ASSIRPSRRRCTRMPASMRTASCARSLPRLARRALPRGREPACPMAIQKILTPRRRLDQLLVERRLFESRSRARDAVARGTVSVAGAVASKPGLMVAVDADLEVADAARHYVSRAALKLLHGLDHFGLGPRGCHALDIGASTGGFTQVLLERGAAHVAAIDVGHGQLHATVAADPRVTNVEGLNARGLSLAAMGGVAPDFLVCDVSFISLRLALPTALELAQAGARGIFLVKPQFEVGRQAI